MATSMDKILPIFIEGCWMTRLCGIISMCRNHKHCQEPWLTATRRVGTQWRIIPVKVTFLSRACHGAIVRPKAQWTWLVERLDNLFEADLLLRAPFPHLTYGCLACSQRWANWYVLFICPYVLYKHPVAFVQRTGLCSMASVTTSL